MPAPDAPPPPPHVITERPLAVHLHAKFVDPEALVGGVAIVIDALRASVTMTAALANGAAHVEPVMTVEEGLAAAGRYPRERVVLGGERGGVLIPGFDLDNSPSGYTRERVGGRVLVFTTTNGTAALLHARRAALVLVGSFVNLAAVCDAVARDPRPVHIVCCGTREEIGLDDVLPAGAMVERLLAAGRQVVADDSALVAARAFRGAVASPGGVLAAMRSSRGGRNLVRLGLDADIEFCSRVDTLPVVPRFDPADGRVSVMSGRP